MEAGRTVYYVEAGCRDTVWRQSAEGLCGGRVQTDYGEVGCRGTVWGRVYSYCVEVGCRETVWRQGVQGLCGGRV